MPRSSMTSRQANSTASLQRRAPTTQRDGERNSEFQEARASFWHFKDPRFKPLYEALPARVRDVADKNFTLLKQDIRRCTSSASKGDLWSVRVGRSHRALAIEGKDGFQWFWIGSHG